MLSDLYTYVTTSCPAYVSRMGYLSEAIRMRRRSRRRSGSWQPHLDETRAFVLAAAGRSGKKRTIVILGSGLLLDVPLAGLSRLYENVVLADVVCLSGVRKQIRQYGNATFIGHDVTGVAERLFQNSAYGLYELPEPEPFAPDLVQRADLVVSLNILSQLTVILRDYVLLRSRTIPEEAIDGWCKRIVQAHIDMLRGLSCPVCLVADTEYVKRDKEGNVIERGSTVCGIDLPAAEQSWRWNITRIGDESPNSSKELLVGAWELR